MQLKVKIHFYNGRHQPSAMTCTLIRERWSTHSELRRTHLLPITSQMPACWPGRLKNRRQTAMPHRFAQRRVWLSYLPACHHLSGRKAYRPAIVDIAMNLWMALCRLRFTTPCTSCWRAGRCPQYAPKKFSRRQHAPP